MSEETSELAQFLAGRDWPCPNCQYNLKGMTAHSCPECGVALALTVSEPTMPLMEFLAAVIGVSAGLGFFVWIFVIQVMSGATLLADWKFFAIYGFAIVVFLGMLAVLLANRRKFCALQRNARVILGVLGAASSAIVCGLLMAVAWIVMGR